MDSPAGMGEPRPPRLILGDCLSVMRGMDAGSVDAVVTDPPAGISFMGKSWDNFGGRANPNAERDRNAANRGPGAGMGNQPFGYSGAALPKSKAERTAFIDFLAERMAEAARVIKPGHYALVWALPRTSHWTACATEDAGWTLVERIAHVFGQGFPKSKARLKPAVEDWWLCRAPGGGKVRELNIDACRVAVVPGDDIDSKNPHTIGTIGSNGIYGEGHPSLYERNSAGRWPSNLVLTHSATCRPAGTRKVKGSNVASDKARSMTMAYHGNGSGTAPRATHASPDGTETIEAWLCSDDCPIKLLDAQAGERPGCKSPSDARCQSKFRPDQGAYQPQGPIYPDSGSASRFFPTFAWSDADFFPLRYVAKASRRERNEGLEGMPIRSGPNMNHAGRDLTNPRNFIPGGTRDRVAKGLPPVEPSANHHPTVKPLALMRWLVRLITPPDGTVLDPFMGSGTTGLACMAEGFGFVGIESDPEYHRIAARRLAEAAASTPLFAGAAPSAAP